MDANTLNKRCVELMQSQGVRAHMWHPGMFWEVGDIDNPAPAALTESKVDLEELEVLLAAAAGEESRCADVLNQRNGRGDFIRRAVRRGDMPLLSRRAD